MELPALHRERNQATAKGAILRDLMSGAN